MDNVSLGDEMRQDFSSAGRVSGAFTVHSIEDVGHEESKNEYIVPMKSPEMGHDST